MAVSLTDSSLRIHRAAELGDVKEVRKLLKLKVCDVNCVNSLGQTPAHVAALNGHADTVLCLIEFHCDLKAKGWRGRSVLHNVCQSGATSLVQTMVSEHKADVDAVDEDEVLPIHVAAWKGHTDIVSFLMKFCDPNKRGGIGRSLLHHACQGGNVSLVKTLIKNSKYKIDVAALDIYRDPPIHVAAGKGYADVVLCLIKDFKCDYNVKGHKGSSLLHRACHGGNLSLVQTLIRDYKANVNAIDNEKEAPIHVAAWRGHANIVQSLIKDFVCDPNMRGRNERSLLHEACQSGNITLVKALVEEYKAEINAKDVKNRSPFHITVASDHFEIALYLVKRGCDISILGIDGNVGHAKSLVDLLCKEQETSCTTALNSDVRAHELLCFITKFWDDDGIARAKLGRFLLHNACKCNKAELVKVLIKQAISPLLLTDSKGNTALHIASHLNHVKCVQALLDANSPILMKNCSGETPFDVAKSEAKQLLQQYEVKNPNCVDLQKRYDFYLEHVKQKYNGKYSVTRVFVLGEKYAGKSSLIVSMKRSFTDCESFEQVSVPPHTAGIIPSDYRDQRYGMLKFYDFAGDQEYYSSHAAILERISSLTYGHDFFIIAVDLNYDDDKIKDTLHYWVSFIKNQKFPGNRLSLVVIGSHVDSVDGQTIPKKIRLLEVHCEKFKSYLVTDQVAWFTLDCRDPRAHQFDAFKDYFLSLKKLSPAYPLNFDLSLLVGVLEKDFSDVTVCPMQNIQAHIKETGICLPTTTEHFFPIIYTLHVAGYLLILNIHENCKYVVLKCSVLMNEVFRLLFSEDELRKVESYNIGIIPDSIIKNILPSGITDECLEECLEECLVHLQFCQRINHRDVNVFSSLSKFSPGQNYLFFPALCKADKDKILFTDVHVYSNSWLAYCHESYDYFPPRFLHVLLLKLVFGFTLSVPRECSIDAKEEERKFQRRCIMWKRGIYWQMREDIECMVKLVDGNKGIVVITRSEENCSDLCDTVFNELIACVMKVKTKFCHSIKPSFFLLDSVQDDDYTKKDHQFAMSDVITALHNPNVDKVISVLGTKSHKINRAKLIRLRKCSLWYSIFPIKILRVLDLIEEVVDPELLSRFGLELGLSEEMIKVKDKSVGTFRMELVREWMSSSIEPPCWWHIVQALKKIDYNFLAQEIGEKHYANHVRLQKQLLDKKYQDDKPDEGFLELLSNVLCKGESTIKFDDILSSLATYLTLSENEVEKMMEAVKNLSQEKRMFHMLEQWKSRENATYGKLHSALLTSYVFHYGTIADTIQSVQPSTSGDISRQSLANDSSIAKPQLQEDTSEHFMHVDPSVDSSPLFSGHTPSYQLCTFEQPTCTEMHPAYISEQPSYGASQQSSIPTQTPGAQYIPIASIKPATTFQLHSQQSTCQPQAKHLLQEEFNCKTPTKKPRLEA